MLAVICDGVDDRRRVGLNEDLLFEGPCFHTVIILEADLSEPKTNNHVINHVILSDPLRGERRISFLVIILRFFVALLLRMTYSYQKVQSMSLILGKPVFSAYNAARSHSAA